MVQHNTRNRIIQLKYSSWWHACAEFRYPPRHCHPFRIEKTQISYSRRYSDTTWNPEENASTRCAEYGDRMSDRSMGTFCQRREWSCIPPLFGKLSNLPASSYNCKRNPKRPMPAFFFKGSNLTRPHPVFIDIKQFAYHFNSEIN